MIDINRTIIPRLDHEREKAAAVSSKVKIRKMTAEEFEKHFVNVKPYTDQDGIVREPGVRQRLTEALMERRKKKSK